VRRATRPLLVALALGAALAAVAAAQEPAAPATAAVAPPRTGCTVDTLDVAFPRRWLGTTIGQITVRSRNIETPFKLANTAARYLHRPTQLNVALNELSFAPGDAMDSLAVQESVRRLRLTGLYSEVIVEGTKCDDGVTAITLWTRDSWSLRSSLRFSDAGTSRASFSEVNLFGTGRAVAVTGENVDGRNALAVSFIDPHVFDTRLRASALMRAYADGREWNWSVRTPNYSDRDVWRVALTSAQERRLGYDSATQTNTNIARRGNALTASRLVLLGATAAYTVVFGAENQFANELVTQPGFSLSPNSVQRNFTAPLLGLSRRSRQVGSIDWLVPGQAPAELREGLEGEIVFGVGHDLYRDARITHLDGWVGITQLLDPNTIFTGDVWSSGYWSDDSVQNGTLRTSIAMYQKASKGLWIVRAAWEHIYSPDPDVFALSTIDPLLRLLAPSSRLAEQALNVTTERSLHLYAKEGRWVLDGAVFAALSDRERSYDGVATDPTNYRAVIVGIGFRQIRDQPTQSPIRLDIGRAVYRSQGLPNRWIVVLSSVPWINAGRTRDGLREAQ
jgi:hypothetical protein